MLQSIFVKYMYYYWIDHVYSVAYQLMVKYFPLLMFSLNFSANFEVKMAATKKAASPKKAAAPKEDKRKHFISTFHSVEKHPIQKFDTFEDKLQVAFYQY